MLISLPFLNRNSKPLIIDTSEAYNLWDVLNSKYMQADKLKLWKNYIHDRDLLGMLETAERELLKSIEQIERNLQLSGIKGPDKYKSVIKTSANSEVLDDETIAQDYYFFLQEMIELMLRAARTSTTNDQMRNMFIKQLKNMVEFIDLYVKYLKLKGWLGVPPLYKLVPKEVNDKLDTGEAYHLWNHTTYRYDNMHQTDIYHAFAHDVDFKALLKTGMQVLLKKQINLLEKELEHFGIPVPKRPSSVYVTPSDTTILDDDHMYRMILTGIQGTASLHAQAYKQCFTNERIRNIFKTLLYSEIDCIDDLIKFGKIKGWLHPAPQYRLQ
ncbi:DUF3231 family protein [Desulfoscipio gibsoniae]